MASISVKLSNCLKLVDIVSQLLKHEEENQNSVHMFTACKWKAAWKLSECFTIFDGKIYVMIFLFASQNGDSSNVITSWSYENSTFARFVERWNFLIRNLRSISYLSWENYLSIRDLVFRCNPTYRKVMKHFVGNLIEFLWRASKYVVTFVIIAIKLVRSSTGKQRVSRRSRIANKKCATCWENVRGRQ